MECKQNINGLDLGKFLMAICVVAAHTHPLINCENRTVMMIYNNIVGGAVPFFFVTSAWLIGVKQKNVHASVFLAFLKKRIFHFVKLYFIWELIYFPICVYGYYFNGQGFIFNSVDYIRKFFLVGSNYYSYQFWFLLAIIYMLVLLYILLKLEFSVVGILIISIVCSFIGNFINYSISTDFSTGVLQMLLGGFVSLFGESSILKNFIYIALGIFMAKYQIVMSAKWIILLGIAGIVGKCLLPRPWCEIVYPLEIVALFQLCLQLKLGERTWLFINLRKCSMVLYYSHLYFFFLYCFIQKNFQGYGLEGFMVCLVYGLILGELVIYMGRYQKFQWIDRIF